jgi:metallo-beta-lactamase class B
MYGKALLALAPLALLGASPPALDHSAASKDIATACGPDRGAEDWSRAAPPAHVYGNTWYVGTCGITVLLIETGAGLVLTDGGPQDAAPLVLANIRALGFDPQQVKWILATHEHFDHGGAIAALQKATGAKLAVGPFAAQAYRTGRPFPDDPQAALLKDKPMPPARVDRVMKNGNALTLGYYKFSAWATPTHSPGSTSWTWNSCEVEVCLKLALADSVGTISADGYRFTSHRARLIQAQMGLTAIAALPCEIVLTPHPSGSNLFARLSGKAPLLDPRACRDYAARGTQAFDERLARERAVK